MEYKGYYGTVEFNKEDQVFFGKVKSIPCLVSYESDTSEGLFQAFQEAVDDYLACSIILKEFK